MQKHIGRPKHISRSAAKLVNAPLNVSKANAKLAERKAEPARPRFKHEQPPDKFTYALAAYTAERRKDGWWIGKTVPSFVVGERTTWKGPFESIESACLSIARHLSVELADRHTRSVESHKIARTDPLYGLKPTTRLRAR